MVQFKGHRKGYYHNRRELHLQVGQYCLVEADRGRDLGRVTYVGPGQARVVGPGAASRVCWQVADAGDLARLHDNRGDEWDFWDICQEKIQARRLNMNLVTVERQFDHKKITFYFTAEKRVDFRELVRDLAADLPHAHRIAPDRRARRGPAQGRARRLRPRILLLQLPARLRAGDPEDGQGPAAAPESRQALGSLRPPALLPDLRARDLPATSRRRLPRVGTRVDDARRVGHGPQARPAAGSGDASNSPGEDGPVRAGRPADLRWDSGGGPAGAAATGSGPRPRRRRAADVGGTAH